MEERDEAPEPRTESRRTPGPRRPPRSVGPLLLRFLRDPSGGFSGALVLLASSWESVVGPSRARLVEPVALDEDGTLWLRSSDYAAKTELLFAGGEIASRANAALGSSLVRRIRFRA